MTQHTSLVAPRICRHTAADGCALGSADHRRDRGRARRDEVGRGEDLGGSVEPALLEQLTR